MDLGSVFYFRKKLIKIKVVTHAVFDVCSTFNIASNSTFHGSGIWGIHPLSTSDIKLTSMR